MGPVGVIQISTLVHDQWGGGRPRAGVGLGSGGGRANARTGSAGGQLGDGGPASCTSVVSRIPFPFPIDPMPNSLAVLVIKTGIVFVLLIVLLVGWC